MVYLVDTALANNGIDPIVDDSMDTTQQIMSQNGPSTSTNRIPDSALEDPIDVFLSKQDGLIHREKDPQL